MNSTQSIFQRLILALVVFTSAIYLPAQTVSTFVTNQSVIGDDMVVDSRGNIYVSGGVDSTVVWKISSLGFASEFGGDFDGPTGIAIDADDSVFVVNSSTGVIDKVSADGTKEEFLSDLFRPSSLAVDSDGRVFVALELEAENQVGTSIQRISSTGDELRPISGDEVNAPVSVTIDDGDNVYFVNQSSNEIYKVVSGRTSPELFATLQGVTGINQINFVDGHIYVPVPGENRIYRINVDGESEIFAGTRSEGVAASFILDEPNCIAGSPDGSVLYVCNNGTNDIQKFEAPAVAMVSTIESAPTMVGDGLVLDSAGNVFIASGNGDEFVWKVTPDGVTTEFANGLDRAVGIAIDSEDNIFVGNYGSGDVNKITPEGVKTTFISGLDGPAGVAVDSADNVYINQFGANGSGTGSRITRISPTGESSVFASGGFLNDGIGIAIDDEDSIYFTNWSGGSVYKIPNGSDTPELFAEIEGISNINQISYSKGYVYVPAPLNEKIYRVDMDGNYELFAGTGINGTIDGRVSGAAFSRPNSIGANVAGDIIYVAEKTARKLRKIEFPKNQVSTLAANQSLIGDGLAVDDEGNIFIASGNGDSVVWKVSSDGVFTEFANGFSYAVGVAIDVDQNVFVNNYDSNVLTKMTPEGVKSDFATGLNGPAGLAIDSLGNIYVSEFGADFSGDGARIMRFTPSGESSVFASGGFLKDVIGIAIDEQDNVYFTNFSGGNVYRIPAGSTVQEEFAVISSSTEINQITYSEGYVYIPANSLNQIYRVDLKGNVERFAGSGSAGSADGGLDSATFTEPNSIAANAAGDKLYVIDGQPTSSLRVIDVLDLAKPELVNLSVRANSGSGENTLILGFVSEEVSSDSEVLVRAVGPGLADFEITGWAADPAVSLIYDDVTIASNENWEASSNLDELVSASETVGAFPLMNGDDDVALVESIQTGVNHVHISDAVGGVALGEVYKLPNASGRFLNMSCRTETSDGEEVLIGGFVLSGEGAVKVLIRAVGPELESQGVTGFLDDPELSLYSGNDRIAMNQDWGDELGEDLMSECFDSVGAFSLSADSGDSALLVSLMPGAYTAIVSSEAEEAGVALLEIYLVE